MILAVIGRVVPVDGAVEATAIGLVVGLVVRDCVAAQPTNRSCTVKNTTQLPRTRRDRPGNSDECDKDDFIFWVKRLADMAMILKVTRC